jgi:dihydrofolate reductase
MASTEPASGTPSRPTSSSDGRNGNVVIDVSISLDGFIAGVDDSPEQPLGVGGDRLFEWFRDGDTPSRWYPSFKMSAVSAELFDRFADRVGAVIAGRRTYDVSDAWGGEGPQPGIPLFVVTHRVPETVPQGDPAYTFVTDGIERAIERARAAAGGKEVSLMGSKIAQQCLEAGLLDEITIHLVPVLLGGGVRLFGSRDPKSVDLSIVRVVDAPGVTHLTYEVVRS